LQNRIWWERDNIKEGVLDCNKKVPVLDGKIPNVVVGEQMNLDQVVPFLDLADNPTNAWTFAEIRDGIPARKE
jgi:hypothetical protein